MIKNKLIVGLVGKDGRTTAIEKALRASSKVHEVCLLHDWKSDPFEVAMEKILARAKEKKPDFVVIGPEEPLAAGVVDKLQDKLGIPCVGPLQDLALLETSKTFTRMLLAEYGIPGNPEFRVFHRLDGIEEYLRELGGYVIKPDGLTGGKGVKISDAHLFSIDEALNYCKEILDNHNTVVIEEKLDGEEFSLMSLCDGIHVAHMVVVQDHKRAYDGDTGPNTGGMGSYSCEDHKLPFLSSDFLNEAKEINAAVAKAILKKTKKKYKGVLYGGFMLTPKGLRLLEYNARFGDPETLNVLSILKTDFAVVCQAIINEELHKVQLVFEKLATVCKYVVPDNYPENPQKGVSINLDDVPPDEPLKLQRYRAALDDNDVLMGSRAIAFVGIGKNLQEAEAIAEKAASSVRGPVFHRKDIGTHELIERRIAHVKSFSEVSNPHFVA
jgi:phosphoribosylamine--glycine ligase